MEQEPKKIRAVIFDCDGTLLDSEKIYMSTWHMVCKKMGYTVPDELLYKTRGKDSTTTRKMYIEAMGEDFPLEEISRKRKALNEELFRNSENIRKPGVETVLKYLKKQNIRMGVASAKTWKVTTDHLECAGILDYFKVVMGGDMVERNKPYPDMFLKVAKELQVEPEECLVLGDTASDVLAANAAGMRAIVILDVVPPDDETKKKAWYVLRQIDECIPIIREAGVR